MTTLDRRNAQPVEDAAEIIRKQAAEIMRLQDAKRRALQVADARAKQVADLRLEIARLRTEKERHGRD